MNKITWSIFIAVAVGAMGLLVFLSNESKLNVSDIDTNKVQVASSQNGEIADHTFGNTNSKVVLIEYGDFQCSACGTQHPTTKALIEEYKDKIQFVFRNFPLTTIHANAKVAAAAAEAAGIQGKYWEMHNKLYENQSDWDSLTGDERVNQLVSYAEDLGLDTAKFKTDMGSSEVSKKIAFDTALANKISVSGTPTFYLNGTVVDGTNWSDLTKFKALIDSEIEKANN